MPLWMMVIEWLARIILAGLVGLSIWSITIILERRKYLKNFDVDAESSNAIEISKKFKTNKVDQGLSRYFYELQKNLQKGLGVLGTLGSTTPFIGLLGTILGIIVAFGELSAGNAGTNAIMFALAEALILTAVGLFVAIPAVIGFNLFNKNIKSIMGEIQSKLDEHLANKE